MIEKLKWITWSILPLVYDESLSYVELLDKVIAKLNEVIEATNNFTKPVQETIEAWLKSAEGQAAIEQSVGEFIEEYSKTPSFQQVLVSALGNQSAEIQAAAKEATNEYLSSTGGTALIEKEVDLFLDVYVKSNAFKEVVGDFVLQLNEILRGDKLDIKQITSADIFSRKVTLTSAEMSKDYSVNRRFFEVGLTDANIVMGQPNNLNMSLAEKANFSFKPLYMGFSTGDNKNQIKMVAEPTDDSDVATKKYVDEAANKNPYGNGFVLFVNIYQGSQGIWKSEKPFSYIKENVNIGNTVVLVCNLNNPAYLTYVGGTGTTAVFAAILGVASSEALTANTRYPLYYYVNTVTISSDNSVKVDSTTWYEKNYLRSDGSIPARGTLSMGNNQITNLAAPFNPTDAANKEYVDSNAGGAVIAEVPLTSENLVNSKSGLTYTVTDSEILKKVHAWYYSHGAQTSAGAFLIKDQDYLGTPEKPLYWRVQINNSYYGAEQDDGTVEMSGSGSGFAVHSFVYCNFHATASGTGVVSFYIPTNNVLMGYAESISVYRDATGIFWSNDGDHSTKTTTLSSLSMRNLWDASHAYASIYVRNADGTSFDLTGEFNTKSTADNKTVFEFSAIMPDTGAQVLVQSDPIDSRPNKEGNAYTFTISNVSTQVTPTPVQITRVGNIDVPKGTKKITLYFTDFTTASIFKPGVGAHIVNGPSYNFTIDLTSQFPEGTSVTGYITYEVDGYAKAYGALNGNLIAKCSTHNVGAIDWLTKVSFITGVSSATHVYYVAS